MLLHPVVPAALLAVLSSAVLGQKLLHTFQGDPSWRYGSIVRSAGDVDRDGFPDVMISWSVDSNGECGVEFRSGRTGQVGLTIRGVRGSGFGIATDAGGDANGDGYGDILVGANLGNRQTGQVFVFSGRDGSLLRQIDGTAYLASLGQYVRWLGDVDRDGRDDILASEPGYVVASNLWGRLTVFSGGTGKPLYQINAISSSDRFSLVDPGDWNRDGFADFGIGRRGGVQILSGKDGSGLLMFSPVNAGGLFILERLGDVSGDGVDDFIGQETTSNSTASVHCYSGKDGRLLYTVPTSRGLIGHGLAVLSDIDRDGVRDLAAVAPNPSGNAPPVVEFYSGKTGRVLHTIAGPSSLRWLEMGGAGDVDRDGLDDVVVSFGRTTVRVFSSAPTVRPFRTFGSGCSGRPTPPLLRAVQEPKLGQDFVLEVSHLTSASGALIVGFSDQRWGALTLPLDLAALGMTGCKLWVSWFTTIPIWSGGATWQWRVKVPFDYSLLGAPVFLQSFGPDLFANPLGVATSGGGHAVVGT